MAFVKMKFNIKLWLKDKYYSLRGYIPVNFGGYRIYITKKMHQEITVPSIDEIVCSKPSLVTPIQWWRWDGLPSKEKKE